MKIKGSYDLLAAYLRNTCTDNERALVEDWLKNDDNKRKLDALRQEWTCLTDADEMNYYPEKEKMLHQILSKTSKSSERKSKQRNWSFMYALTGAAAVWLYFAIFHKTETPVVLEQFVTIESPQGSKTRIKLSDSSIVTLNAGAQLTYSNFYNQSNRTLQLEGEAYFEIAQHNPLACRVSISGIEVHVKGTQFNVFSQANDSLIIVSLDHGAVEIKARDSLLSNLIPDQTIEVNKYNLRFKIHPSDSKQKIWKQNKLRIYNQSLSQVCNQLSLWYGVNIDLLGDYDTYKYTFVIYDENLLEVLSLLDRLTPLKYQIKGNNVSVQVR